MHSLALRNTGAIVGFGANNYGQSNPPGGTVSSPIVERYSYDVYGKPTIKAPNGSTRTTSAFGNRFMFTGREYDTETSNYYYRARYYSPKIGRFLQPDQITMYMQYASVQQRIKGKIPGTFLTHGALEQFVRGYPIGKFFAMNTSGGFLRANRFGIVVERNLYQYCLNNPLNELYPYGLGIWSYIGEACVATGTTLCGYAAVATAPAWALPTGVALAAFGIGNMIGDAIFDDPLKNPPGKKSFTNHSQELEKACNEYPTGGGN